MSTPDATPQAPAAPPAVAVANGSTPAGMSRVVNEKWSPEKATDEMVKRIVALVDN